MANILEVVADVLDIADRFPLDSKVSQLPIRSVPRIEVMLTQV